QHQQGVSQGVGSAMAGQAHQPVAPKGIVFQQVDPLAEEQAVVASGGSRHQEGTAWLLSVVGRARETNCFSRFSSTGRSNKTRRPQIRQRRPMSAPRRTTSQS